MKKTILTVLISFLLAISAFGSTVKGVHGITIRVDGQYYVFDGPADGKNGAKDIPGHFWIQAGNNLIGKHFNTGPFGAKSWWAKQTKDAALLYYVIGEINEWSEEIAATYAELGYIHYHEIVRTDNGQKHPTKVVWLKHIAAMDFYLDGGPHPEASHQVKVGTDLNFLPNGFKPY